MRNRKIKISIFLRQDQVEMLEKKENMSKEVREALDYYWATSPGTSYKIVKEGDND